LFEVTAEVIIGLKKAFTDYEKRMKPLGKSNLISALNGYLYKSSLLNSYILLIASHLYEVLLCVCFFYS